MKSRDVIKRLKDAGWKKRSVKGSHHKYENPEGKILVVPHPKKDLPTGTLQAIFKQAGLKWRPE